MNATQRKFLIDRINKKIDDQIENLQKAKEKYPSLSNYLFKALLNDTLSLQPQETILNGLKNKALAAKEGENWLSGERMGFDKESTVKLNIKDLILMPEDYHKEVERVALANQSINNQIKELKVQQETLEVRIQLASDKTLQGLIQEVDDMGDLKLVNTKLKLLN